MGGSHETNRVVTVGGFYVLNDDVIRSFPIADYRVKSTPIADDSIVHTVMGNWTNPVALPRDFGYDPTSAP